MLYGWIPVDDIIPSSFPSSVSSTTSPQIHSSSLHCRILTYDISPEAPTLRHSILTLLLQHSVPRHLLQ